MRILIIAAALAISNGAIAQIKTIAGSAFVVDGDTVVVAGVTVRLKGVDAPEPTTKYGLAATERMRPIVGNWLRCELTGEKTHAREVGYCFNAAGQDIGEQIVTSGRALACRFYSLRYVPVEQPDAIKRLPRAPYCTQPIVHELPVPRPRLPTPSEVTSTRSLPVTAYAPKTDNRPRRPGITCMYPDDRDAAGRRCGKRAASVRSGGR